MNFLNLFRIKFELIHTQDLRKIVPYFLLALSNGVILIESSWTSRCST